MIDNDFQPFSELFRQNKASVLRLIHFFDNLFMLVFCGPQFSSCCGHRPHPLYVPNSLFWKVNTNTSQNGWHYAPENASLQEEEADDDWGNGYQNFGSHATPYGINRRTTPPCIVRSKVQNVPTKATELADIN